MQRRGFSMIELIFVIVIVATLAVVAIPKLAATRDDAIISTVAQNTMTAAFEIASYATAKGRTETSLSTMSNAIKSLVDKGLAVDTGASKANIFAEKGGSTCIVLWIDGVGTNTETIKLEDGGGSSGNCVRLKSLIDFSNYPMPLHGHLISF